MKRVVANSTPHFDGRQIVDLTVLTATYNMHSRVLEAPHVNAERGQ